MSQIVKNFSMGDSPFVLGLKKILTITDSNDNYNCFYMLGGMAEWFKATVLKTVE